MRSREPFEALVERYREKIFHLAWSILGDRARAEDAVQEVFLRIWKGLDSYRGESSLATWIYAITRNTCLSARKAHAARAALPIEEPGVLARVEAVRTEPPVRSGIALDPLLAELPEAQRQVIALFYLEEKSYEEVARLLDLPLGTVKTHLHRARKHIAGAIARSKLRGATR